MAFVPEPVMSTRPKAFTLVILGFSKGGSPAPPFVAVHTFAQLKQGQHLPNILCCITLRT